MMEETVELTDFKLADFHLAEAFLRHVCYYTAVTARIS